jgi:hypothetical protein
MGFSGPTNGVLTTQRDLRCDHYSTCSCSTRNTTWTVRSEWGSVVEITRKSFLSHLVTKPGLVQTPPMYDHVGSVDMTRTVHYEGSLFGGGPTFGDRGDGTATDFDSCMYCEPGNTQNNIKEYWDSICASNRLVGGFLWDWHDQPRHSPARPQQHQWQNLLHLRWIVRE